MRKIAESIIGVGEELPAHNTQQQQCRKRVAAVSKANRWADNLIKIFSAL